MKKHKNPAPFSAQKAHQRAQQLYDILKINEKYAIPQLRYYISRLQEVSNHHFTASKQQISLGEAERIRLNAVANTNNYIAEIARAMKRGTTSVRLEESQCKLQAIMEREHKAIAVFRKGMQSLISKATLDRRDHDAALLILNETVFARNELNRIRKAFALLIAELLKKGGPKRHETVKMVIAARRSSLRHATLELDSCVSPGSVSNITGLT